MAVYRGDNGVVLLAGPPPFAPTGQVIGDFQSPTLTIHCPGSGTGKVSGSLPMGKLDVVPDRISDFKAAVGGASDVRVFTLTNTGGDCLTVSAVADAGPTWVVKPDRQMPVSLRPTESFHVSVEFHPVEAKLYGPTSLAVTRTPTEGDTELQCTGTGRTPVTRIGFEPANLSLVFGAVRLNTTSTKSFRIRNDGDTPLTVSTFAPAAGSHFQWTPWSGTLPTGTFRDVLITFTPVDESSLEGSLMVQSDALGSPHQLTVSGRGYVPTVVSHDLFIRDNLEDDGTEPLKGGGISASPDIILRNSEVLDPQAEFGSLEAQQSNSLSDPVEAGQDNYLYLRVSNRGTQTGVGTATVYWTSPSTLPTPEVWKSIGQVPVPDVAPGEMKVVGPLTWTRSEIPGAGHFCFIAIVASPGEPAPVPTNIQTIEAFQRLIRDSNNATWRNFDVLDALSGSKQSLQCELRGWPTGPIHSDLKIDVQALPSDAVITLRLPRHADDGAFRNGLTLVRETQRERTFAVSTAQLCSLAGILIGTSEAYKAILEVVLPDDMDQGAYRIYLAQEVSGREMGRVSAVLAVGNYPFVANPRSKEVHVAECEWVQKMNPRHRVAYRGLERAVKQGYNGCHFCLREYSTD
jgi:hypothetical protein